MWIFLSMPFAFRFFLTQAFVTFDANVIFNQPLILPIEKLNSNFDLIVKDIWVRNYHN